MNKIVILGATGHVGFYMALYAKELFENKGFDIIAAGRRKRNSR